jgi:hypothetical protein
MISLFLFIPITVLLFAATAWLFFLPQRQTQRHTNKQRGKTLEYPCPSCQHTLFIGEMNLRPLVSSEIAMVVKEMPKLNCTKFAETRCEYCQSSLTFRMDKKSPEFLFVDNGEPVHHKHDCSECKQPLQRPTWPQDAYADFNEIPFIPDKVGLECPFCASVACVQCLEKNTRKRTQDETYLCPRCFRGPVDIVHYY